MSHNRKHRFGNIIKNVALSGSTTTPFFLGIGDKLKKAQPAVLGALGKASGFALSPIKRFFG